MAAFQYKVKDFLFRCLINGASNGTLSPASGIVDFAPFNMQVVSFLKFRVHIRGEPFQRITNGNSISL
jgi:hypothetical protein